MTEVAVIAFGKQVQVHLAQQRAEAVGVFAGLLAPGPLDTQCVRTRLGELADEQPRHVRARQRPQHVACLAVDHIDAQRLR